MESPLDRVWVVTRQPYSTDLLHGGALPQVYVFTSEAGAERALAAVGAVEAPGDCWWREPGTRYWEADPAAEPGVGPFWLVEPRPVDQPLDPDEPAGGWIG